MTKTDRLTPEREAADDTKLIASLRNAETKALVAEIDGAHSNASHRDIGKRDPVLQGWIDNCGSLLRIIEDNVAALAAAASENGRLRSAVTEAYALTKDGSDYDRLHVSGILSAALPGGTE